MYSWLKNAIILLMMYRNSHFEVNLLMGTSFVSLAFQIYKYFTRLLILQGTPVSFCHELGMASRHTKESI